MNDNIRSRISRVSRVSRASRSSRHRSLGFMKHIKVEDRLFSEDDDDVRDNDGNFINIDIERLRFPLPVQTDESLCRDEYLNKLLKPFKKVYIEIVKRVSTVDDEIRKSILTPEGMAILKMIDTDKKQRTETYEVEYFFSTTMPPEEKERLYAICMERFQKSAIEFLSVRLYKQLETLMSSWPNQLEEKEVPPNFFAWSSDYFIERNNKSDSVNMDVIVRINSQAVLDSVKYSKDIGQIIKLIKQIVEDYKTGANMCESSMAEIKKANFDINSPWLKDSEKDYKIYQKLLIEDRRINNICIHQNEEKLQSQIDVMAGCLPIIQRYRRGWMHSTLDQITTQLVSKEKDLQDELKSVSDKMEQNELTKDADQQIYKYQINNLKASIYQWEQRFEIDQYDFELNLAKMRSSLDKENDYKEFLEKQIKMFRERVAIFLEKEREIESAMQRLQNAKPVIVKKSNKGHKRGRSTERGAKSSDMSKEKKAKLVDKSNEKSAKSVDKSTEKSAETSDKNTKIDTKSVETKKKGAKSIDKSKKKSAMSVDKINKKSVISRDKNIKKSSVISRDRSKERRQNRINAKKSREKSVGRIQKLINTTTSDDKNPEEIGKSINTTKSRDKSNERSRRAKSIKTTNSRVKSKEGSVILGDKSKERKKRAKSIKTTTSRVKSQEGSVIPREKSIESSQKAKSMKTKTPREKSKERSQRAKLIKTTTSRDKSKEGSVILGDKSKERNQRAKSIKTTTSRDKSQEGRVIPREKSKESSVIPRKKSKERSQQGKSIKRTTSKDKSREQTQKSIRTIVSREKSKETIAILSDTNKESSVISRDKSNERSQILLNTTISGDTIIKVTPESINKSPKRIQYLIGTTILGDQTPAESLKSIKISQSQIKINKL